MLFVEIERCYRDYKKGSGMLLPVWGMGVPRLNMFFTDGPKRAIINMTILQYSRIIDDVRKITIVLLRLSFSPV